MQPAPGKPGRVPCECGGRTSACEYHYASCVRGMRAPTEVEMLELCFEQSMASRMVLEQALNDANATLRKVQAIVTANGLTARQMRTQIRVALRESNR